MRSATNAFVIPHNIDQLSVMWEKCSDGDEAKKRFLNALNANTGKVYSWTLRPRFWTRGDSERVLDWNVHAVHEAE